MATVTDTGNSMQTNTSVYSPYGGSNLSYDSESDLYVPDTNLDQTRQQVVDLYNSIGAAYEKLINSGRTDLAYNLKESADRLSSTGSELGVNSFARQQSITDLYNDMNAAQQVIDDQTIVQMLSTQASTLSQIQSLDTESFNQAMEIYNALQAQKNTEWEQQQYEEEQAAATAATEEDSTFGQDSTDHAEAFQQQAAANLEAAGSDNTSQIAWELPEYYSADLDPKGMTDWEGNRNYFYKDTTFTPTEDTTFPTATTTTTKK